MKGIDNSSFHFTPVWEPSSGRESVVISSIKRDMIFPPAGMASIEVFPAGCPKPRRVRGLRTLCPLGICVLLVSAAFVWHQHAGEGIDSFHPLRDSRFVCWPLSRMARPVHGVDLATQAAIGWSREGHAFPLVSPDLVLATHNGIPDEIFFRIRDGSLAHRRVVERHVVLSGPDSRPQLQTGRLDHAFSAQEAVPLPIPEATARLLPEVVIFGRRGRTGVERDVSVVATNILGDERLPWWPGYALFGHTANPFPGQFQAKRGDSGSPVLAYQEGRWHLIGLTVAASSTVEGSPLSSQHLYLPTLAPLLNSGGPNDLPQAALRSEPPLLANAAKSFVSDSPSLHPTSATP